MDKTLGARFLGRDNVLVDVRYYCCICCVFTCCLCNIMYMVLL